MKRIIFFLGILLSVASSKAQITYEHTYPGPNSPSQARPVIINMGGNDGYKYLYVDYQTNQLNLFNLDHSQYATVTVPTLLQNQSEYRIGYVTWSLFDCDTTKFEYAVLPANWRNSFCIYRQDGALLFKQDSTIAPWCVGCYDLSYNVQPIYNTPQGTKLLLSKPDSLGSSKTTDVYALCGSLPVNVQEIEMSSDSYLRVFPNPANLSINFELTPPNNYEKIKLVIFDITGKELKRETVGRGYQKYTLDVSALPNGMYPFSFYLDNQKLDSGKFIISK
ncbi:MAG: T9SS type A sorting domain-containing protein [Chitinophagales bacterium]|nr:T9SS type A sorting domain-containing protein [Chitinophagales bacterium]